METVTGDVLAGASYPTVSLAKSVISYAGLAESFPLSNSPSGMIQILSDVLLNQLTFDREEKSCSC